MSQDIYTVGVGNYLGGGVTPGNDGTLVSDTIRDLTKGLNAGSLLGSDTSSGAGTAGPLRYESLENSLKIITFDQKELSFWRCLSTTAGCVAPATQTVEEYNRLVDYGTQGRGVALNEGELPSFDNSNYTRESQKVKFYGKSGFVTHVAQAVNTVVGNLLAHETNMLTISLLEELNRHLYYGNEREVAQEINGFFASQVEAATNFNDVVSAETVVDLRGARLTDTALEEASQLILERNGRASTLIAPPSVLTGFAQAYHESKRINLMNGQSMQDAEKGVVSGTFINGFQSQYSYVDFKVDKFMQKTRPLLSTVTATQENAPATPTGVAATVSSSATGSLYTTSALAGSRRYGVVARNRHGRSAMADAGVVAVTTNSAVDIAITNASTVGDSSTSTFDIYATENGNTATTDRYNYLFSVTPAELTAGYNGATAGRVRDLGKILPGLGDALLLEFSNNVLCWKQLGPLSRQSIARIAPSDRFMVLLYGCLQVYAPMKAIRFINVAGGNVATS